MAEGGAYTSIKVGSDADFEYICTPCGEEHIREEAVKYCPECEEFLCTNCVNRHGRRKATISHKLQYKNAAKHGFVVKTKCHYHLDRDIEMYCGAHDMVYCAKCIAKEHRSCSGVSDIEDIQSSSVQQKEIQRLKYAAQNIEERLADTCKKTQKNIDSLENQRDEITKKLEGAEKLLIEHIRKLKREAIGKLKTEYTAVNDELKSTISMVDDMRQDIKKSNNLLQMLTSTDARQQFVQMKLIQKTVNNAITFIDNGEATGTKALCFTENTDLKTSVLTEGSICSIHKVTQDKSPTSQRLYKVKSKKDINIRLHNESYCFVSDVCQLHDGTLILADFDNAKIKMLGMNYKINDYCDLDEVPTGICCTGQNEVAVKMRNDKVQFISVGCSLSKLRNISVAGGDVYGMTYCAGELWVSTCSGINIYTTSGTLLKTFNKKGNGLNIFKSVAQHMAVIGETVIIADNCDGAVCLGRDGTVKREMRDDRLVNTIGVCVSSDGTVFLTGNASRNIVMFDRNGICLGELDTEDAGRFEPFALFYDEKKNCIILTSYGFDKIDMFYLSD